MRAVLVLWVLALCHLGSLKVGGFSVVSVRKSNYHSNNAVPSIQGLTQGSFPQSLQRDQNPRTGHLVLHSSVSCSISTAATAAIRRIPFSSSTAVATLVVSLLWFFLLTKRGRQSLTQWLWPGFIPDPAVDRPLPPGSRGCPFIGFDILKGSNHKGPEPFYFEQSQKLGHVPIWKFYFLSQGVVNLTGAALIKKWFVREFDGVIGAEPPTPEEVAQSRAQPSIFGTDNIAFERNKEQHSFLRRLVGAGIQAAKPLPTLQAAANKVIRRMQQEQRSTRSKTNKGAMIAAHPYSVDYTMEFVQKHILGIPHDDRARVREALLVWMNALNSLIASLRIPFIIRRTKAYKARLFLEGQINQQIAHLETDGPDDSILSAMLYARDEESDNARLERPQVVENALFLVAAGAETSANTLTLALLMLGLHPEKYEKLVQEQAAFLTHSNDGTVHVTEDELQQSPYLDAVVQEALRMGPVSGGFPRKVRETINIDGYQVPKGWSIFGSIRLTHQLDPTTYQPDLAHMDPYRGFEPERWLDPATRPQDFIPFSVGARYCLGANLALLEVKVFLATFARTIPSFTLPMQSQKTSVEWDKRSIIPRPTDGVLMTLAADDGKDDDHLAMSKKATTYSTEE